MSRTYRKNIRIGICYGDNRSFYAARRKKRRRILRHNLRNALANYKNEDIDEHIEGDTMPKEDQWNEPTDGHYGINKSTLKIMDRQWKGRNKRYIPDTFYFHKKYDRYLKSKH